MSRAGKKISKVSSIASVHGKQPVTCTHNHVYGYTYMCTWLCTCPCVYVATHICVHGYVHGYVYHVHICIAMYTYVYMAMCSQSTWYVQEQADFGEYYFVQIVAVLL